MIDPFVDLYSLVFRLTIRVGGCREIADSVGQCKKMEELFWAIDQGATPTAVLFPWFPSPARQKKVKATAEVFDWFDRIIKTRREEGQREDDAMQMLLDMDHSTADVIEFVLFVLFAGIINTGLMSAWLFIFLDQEPEWRDKVVAELDAIIDQHAPASGSYASLAERFSSVPPSAWENELPVLDDCIRETIRRVLSTAMLRRVTDGDIQIAGKTVPNGTFLAYSAADTHNDPTIFPNPRKQVACQ
ncbi:cytochrome P450 family protein [Ceratobasidium sp. AG-Ba]|nr:cytochrome P450 family protein [Ceratobasidium sp. AG-Ba]